MEVDIYGIVTNGEGWKFYQLTPHVEVRESFLYLKKTDCLRTLSRANLGFRSGRFHIKTYISDQAAYLGSCNLTGGSLERNGEAGMVWKNTSDHQFLIDYFRYLWQFQSTCGDMLDYYYGTSMLMIVHSP